MLRKGDGFFLSDLLLSLSALSIAAMFLIPSTVFLWKQSAKATLSKNATKILFNELSAYASEDKYPIDRFVRANGNQFKVSIQTRIGGSKEVCVGDANPTPQFQEVCQKIE
ncbi:hypothetical protein A8F94_04350 [Bacillus sp. FJAT-27225]|uniref:hypothetical protein n=1 Tax=Bacillus sp. FJAT-27225 TaxID=1743144 RepID=UPI00080C2326|nr:hypothetical protein [Bacillus sp. FJAT-27225]OCA91097.1 hypothetical protein A8F94_04350 [Bacillus sp. FJAT-27225]